MRRNVIIVLIPFLLVGCKGDFVHRQKLGPLITDLVSPLPKDEKFTIAVVGFVNALTKKQNAETKGFETNLITELVQRKQENVSVVSRSELDKAVQELKFQRSKLFDEAKRKRLGEFLGANIILTGEYHKEYITLHLIDVETAELVSSATSYQNEALDKGIQEIIAQLSANKKDRIAVYASNNSQEDQAFLLSLIRSEVASCLVRGRKDTTRSYEVVSRFKLETVLKELKFQYSDFADKHKRQKLGKFSGASAILVAIYGGEEQPLHLHLLAVETAEVLAASRVPISSFLTDHPIMKQKTDLSSNKEKEEISPSIVSPPPGMVYIKGGKTIIGANDGHEFARPQHSVKVQSFFVDKYLITNAEFEEFVRETGHVTDAERAGGGSLLTESGPYNYRDASWRDPHGNGAGIHDKMEHPVVQISWRDALAYAKWKGKRLLAEVEWEYVARCSDNRQKFIWGNSWPPPDSVGNFSGEPREWSIYIKGYHDGHNFTSPVGSFMPNKYGIYDLAGNVWEWTSTKFAKYPYDKHDGRESFSGDTFRVVRGSAFNSAYRRAIMIAHRFGVAPTARAWNLGFRCAKSAKGR